MVEIKYLKIGGHGPKPPRFDPVLIEKISNWMAKEGHIVEIGYDEEKEKIVCIKTTTGKKPAFEWRSKPQK